MLEKLLPSPADKDQVRDIRRFFVFGPLVLSVARILWVLTFGHLTLVSMDFSWWFLPLDIAMASIGLVGAWLVLVWLDSRSSAESLSESIFVRSFRSFHPSVYLLLHMTFLFVTVLSVVAGWATGVVVLVFLPICGIVLILPASAFSMGVDTAMNDIAVLARWLSSFWVQYYRSPYCPPFIKYFGGYINANDIPEEVPDEK